MSFGAAIGFRQKAPCCSIKGVNATPVWQPTHATPPSANLPRRRWEWWSLFFELCLLLALFVTVFLERAFQRGRAVFLTFFNLASMCVLLSAHDFITDVAIGPINVRDLGQDAVNAAAAGFVLLGITNFGLLIVLGRDFGAPPPAVPAYERPGMGGLGPHGIGFQSSAPV